MKAIKHLITLGVFLTAFLVCGMALANDLSIFDSVSTDSALEVPKLTVTITGNQVTLSWNKVTGATNYVVHYAQKPYDNPDTIKTIDVGDKTTAAYELSPGSSYHVAVKACKNSGSDCSDYSNIHDVIIPLVSTFKNSLGQEFKLIPAGTFTMGGSGSDETQHQVTLTQPFYMQATEVTNGQWKAVTGDTPFIFLGSTFPVEDVSWNDVQSFITKMNLRGEGTYSLPTEAQWEYAARAGSTTAFYNGGITEWECGYDPNLDAIGWYCYNSPDPHDYHTKTHPVGQKAPNAWGLSDMSGNVGEWCQDWYGSYPSSAVTDPTGPLSGTDRVLRGGSWPKYAGDCRSASRSYFMPMLPYYAIGFRMVRLP